MSQQFLNDTSAQESAINIYAFNIKLKNKIGKRTIKYGVTKSRL